jgi:hypothetical protein
MLLSRWYSGNLLFRFFVVVGMSCRLTCGESTMFSLMLATR